jgi:hypothetical protein
MTARRRVHIGTGTALYLCRTHPLEQRIADEDETEF